jgi:cytochrome c oxidase assembly protein subunit 11
MSARWAKMGASLFNRATSVSGDIAMTGTDKATMSAGAIAGGRTALIAAIGLGIVASAWSGMAYASVPLYQLFCQVTGYGGTTQRAQTAGIEVGFWTRRSGCALRRQCLTNGVDWDFRPKQREVELKIGETKQVAYTAHNNSTRKPSTGTATFNVSPQGRAPISTRSTASASPSRRLQPGESIDMPVSLLRRSGYRERSRHEVGDHDHAVLHIFPGRDRDGANVVDWHSGR